MLINCSQIPNKKYSSQKNTSEFAFELYNSVSSINKEDWNSIVNYGSEFLQLPFLSVLENECSQNINCHYSIIYKNNKPIAIAYFQVVDFSADSFENILQKEEDSCLITDYIKKHITNHLKRSAEKSNIRLLILGNSYISGEHGFTIHPETDKLKTIDALSDVIYNISNAEKLRGKIAAVLIKDFYNQSITHTQEFTTYKYHDFAVEPNMIVNILWNTFDDYVNAMSKKYRNRYKTINKKGEALERIVFSEEEIEANATQIELLYKNVHSKAKFRMAAVPVTYFSSMKKTLGSHFNFVAYYYEKKLVGFGTSFKLKNETEAHFIGLDYSLNKEIELYQNMLYDYVKEAITDNSKKLILGRTASEIKSTIGAEAFSLTCYIRHRNVISNKIIKPFVGRLKPSEWIPRNPFK